MTRDSAVHGKPHQWIASGKFPTGSLRVDAPAAVVHVTAIALALSVAMDGKKMIRVAEAARVDRTTLHAILTGNRWPDIPTLVRLQEALGVNLWPAFPPAVGSQSEMSVGDPQGGSSGEAG